MPTVQRYGPRKVDIAAYPGVRKQAAETAYSEGYAVDEAQARQGETLGSLGQQAVRLGGGELAKAWQEERDRADDIAVLNAVTRTGQWKNQRVYNPDDGALTKKGKDAFGLPEQIGSEYQQVTGEIANSLTTDKQRFAYQKYTAEDGLSLDHQIRQHVYGEMQRYEGQELNAFLDNSRNQAILAAGVPPPPGAESTLPRVVGAQLAAQEQALRTHGARLGMGPEQLQQAIDKTRSDTHIGVVQNLLATDQTKGAQEYFEETANQIDPAQRKRLADALKEGHVRKDAQAASDKILAEGGTLTEQRAKAKAIDDPDVRDATLAYLSQEASVRDHAELETERKVARGAYDILDHNHGDWTKIPPTTWEGFDGGLRSALKAYGENVARGTRPQNDDPTYYNLLKTAATEPGLFGAVNLLRYRHLLGDSEFNHLVSVQGSILSGNREALTKQLGPVKLQEDVIDEALTLWGIDPKAKYDEQAGKAKASLQGMLRNQVEIEQALTGKPVGPTELKIMTDKLLGASVAIPGSFWNLWGHAPWMPATQMRLLHMQVTDIPSGQRTQIEEALKQLGRPVSDPAVLQFYQDYVARLGHPPPEQ